MAGRIGARIILVPAFPLTILICSCENRQAPLEPPGPARYGTIILSRRCNDCVIVDDKVYFDFNSSALRSDTQSTLSLQAKWIHEYPGLPITLSGNTDERGTEEYNLALGYRRASAVRDFFVAKGVPENRITVVSYGKERPIAFGNTEADYARNRNVRSSDGVGETMPSRRNQ